MAAKWGTDTTIRFIELYKKNICLWNADVSDYKSRPAREMAYENLARGMKLPGFTVQEVKNKIKNLRSTYCQEVKKIAESKKSGGPIYEPSLRWLKNIEPVFSCVRARAEATDHEDNSSKADEKTVYLAERITPKRSKKPLATPKPIPSKKRKITNIYDETRLQAFEAFGMSVGMQLKSLSEERALMAQSQIQTLLTEYGMADLKEKRFSEAGGSCRTFAFVSSKEEAPSSSPRSNCSNDYANDNGNYDGNGDGNDDDNDDESVISMPEAKYFDRYPDELLNGEVEN